MTTKEKLSALRGLMGHHGIEAYLVPSSDPHRDEYVPDCWQRRSWLSGFTGSAGDLLVTREDAGLWADGRYHVQAAAQLKGSGIRLFKMGEPGIPKLNEHLVRILKPGEVVGVDPQVLSMDASKDLEEALRPVGAKLELIDENLVDSLWTDRPEPSLEPIHLLPVKYSGETTVSKLRRLRKEMSGRGVEAHFLTSLDAIAWLYNIRGRDTSYNPVAIAYALITPTEAILFIRLEKVPPALAKKLAPSVRIRPYDEVPAALRGLAGQKARVWVDGASTSRWAADLLSGSSLVREPSPVLFMKARKNETEVAGMRAAHVRDGVAMVRFLRWLGEAVPKGGQTEISAAGKLDGLRAEGDLFQSLSFDTISAYRGNAALPHYRVTEKTNLPLRSEGIYLVDSGGQYLDGTTDITRTVLLGRAATQAQKDHFTRVLQGHIHLTRASFPGGVRGIQLDILARVPLWDAGLDYSHGTGHGVGHYLCVHEGPQSISAARDTGAALEPGNILSNEPGYYRVGEYGIRTENLVLVVEDARLSGDGKPFLTFETLTLCPIDTRLIERRLLTGAERQWLNDYHRTVYKFLSPHLEAGDRKWLRAACAALPAAAGPIPKTAARRKTKA